MLILRLFTALRPEKKAWSFSQVVWVIRNSDSTTIFLGVLKYWKPSGIVFLFRGSEILYPLLCCLGDQKFWISCVVWESEILNPVLYCLGDQKFWILSCVVWGSEILNPLLCFLGVRNSESSPVLIGGSEILNPECCLGVRNSESPSVLLGDQKSESSPVLFGRSLGNCLEEFYDPLQTGRRFLWVLTPV